MRQPSDHQRAITALARQAITTHTSQDSLLIDPICGSGDILVEAVRAGRMAIGSEHEPYWADMARTRIERATDSGRGGFAAVVNGSVDTLVRSLANDPRPHQASLVLTAPQTGTTVRTDGTGTVSTISEFIEGLVSALNSCHRVMNAESIYGVICWPIPQFDLRSKVERAFTTDGFTFIGHQATHSTAASLLLFRRATRSQNMPSSVNFVDSDYTDR